MSKPNDLLESALEGRAALESGPQQPPDHGPGTAAGTSKSATPSHGSGDGRLMPNSPMPLPPAGSWRRQGSKAA
jgi:hypothetical protein